VSESIRFGNLNYLFMLGLVPFAYLLFWSARAARRKAAEAFTSQRLAPRLLLWWSPGRESMKFHLFALSLLLLTLTLVRPKWGYHAEEVRLQGPDIMIAVDVSRSMLAQDITPDRLTRSVLELKNFASELRRGRAGIVVFAGTAFTLCPITSDHSAFRMFLDGISAESVPHGGTAIGEAIRRCIKSFRSGSSAERMILLMSDGEDLGGDALTAAKSAMNDGIPIYTVGVGTRDGAPIPVQDENGNVGFVKEPDGTVHLSKLNDEVLQEIAAETGGAYSHVSSRSWDIKRRIAAEMSANDTQGETVMVRYYHERFQLPLLLAMLFLFLEAALPRGSRNQAFGRAR